jgi:hypothetical protein
MTDPQHALIPHGHSHPRCGPDSRTFPGEFRWISSAVARFRDFGGALADAHSGSPAKRRCLRYGKETADGGLHRPQPMEAFMKLHKIAMLALVGAAQATFAAEASYDFVACTHSRQIMLEATNDFVAFGVESWGVVASSTTKEWENASTRCTGYMRVAAGKPYGKGVCKWVQASGDTAVGEFEFSPVEAKWTWLTGTGKLAGITGGGTFKQLTSAKPADAGTSQACRRDWGKFIVP